MSAGENRNTTVWPVNSESPDSSVMSRAGLKLLEGGLVAFPTETVYGLGANALDAKAVSGIYNAKGRPSRNPLIVHVVGSAMRRLLTPAWPEAATGGGPTVAIREPAHPVARALILAANRPIAAPSANRSNEISPTLAEHVLMGLGGRIDIILDGGACAAGIESTVLDLSGSAPRLLRPGPISRAQLEQFIGPIEVGSGHLGEAPLPAPGMLARHYSPKTPTFLRSDAEDPAPIPGRRRAILTHLSAFPSGDDVVFSLPNDPAGYASLLYARLHEADAAGVDEIVIVEPPDEPEWTAVRDRLTRAAAKEA